MQTEKVHNSTITATPFSKVKDYAQLAKLRLSLLVVFSAVAGYVLAAGSIIWAEMMYLVLGGFLVTGASNGINQVIERDLDRLMNRTQNRPLPSGRMGVTEAIIFSVILGVVGIVILYLCLNPLSAVLGALALVLYTAVYTPLKRITPFAVMVGAVPGAIPPMLGWVAATNTFGLEPGLLFFVQFMWQFPHFWAIAWKAHDDYKRAGFKLLPSSGGRDKASAFQILVYSLFMIPASLTPVMFGISGYIAGGVVLLAGIWFLVDAIRLYRTCEMKQATRLMFMSFFYLPVVLIAYLIDKV